MLRLTGARHLFSIRLLLAALLLSQFRLFVCFAFNLDSSTHFAQPYLLLDKIVRLSMRLLAHKKNNIYVFNCLRLLNVIKNEKKKQIFYLCPFFNIFFRYVTRENFRCVLRLHKILIRHWRKLVSVTSFHLERFLIVFLINSSNYTLRIVLPIIDMQSFSILADCRRLSIR